MLIIIIIVGLMVLKGNPYEMYIGENNVAPSITHFFGTDTLGRDVFSRTIAGAGFSILMIVMAISVVLVIGVSVGVLSSLAPKWLGDKIILVLDFMNSLPSIVYILLVASLVKPTLWTIPIIIGLCSWMTIARQIRMQLLQEKQQPYILMAKQIETTRWHRLKRYYIPAIYPILGITVIHEAIHVLFAEATISFLGFGLAVNTPTLGNLLMDAQSYFLLGAWWNILFPGLFIAAITLYLLHLKKRHFEGGGKDAARNGTFRFLRRKLHCEKRNISHQGGRQNRSYREKWDW